MIYLSFLGFSTFLFSNITVPLYNIKEFIFMGVPAGLPRATIGAVSVTCNFATSVSFRFHAQAHTMPCKQEGTADRD